MSKKQCAEVGFSKHVDTKDAVNDALGQALPGCGQPDIVFAYSGVAYDPQIILDTIREQVGKDVPVVGGSSQGASVKGESFEGARFIAIACISGVDAKIGHVEDFSENAFESGLELAKQVGKPPEGSSAAIVFYDPLNGGNAKALVDGLAEGGYPAVYGAATGQPWGKFSETFQFCGDHLATKGVVFAVLDGVTPVAELTHGAESIGLELKVTKAEGNIVHEINERPALDVWCEQLGVEAEGHVENSADWALGVKPEGEASYEGLITRAPFKLDNENRALIFQAPIPQGAHVQVCVRTKEAVYDRAVKMGERMSTQLEGKSPLIALGFECGARPAPFLGSDLANKEVCKIQEQIGPDVPWIGTYAWGEIAPVGGRTEFHNFTFPLCILCEG